MGKNSTQELMVGDIVRLKTGGPDMVINRVFGNEVHGRDFTIFNGANSVSCIWFDSEHHLQKSCFIVDTLEKV